jgi:hypothetical protein
MHDQELVESYDAKFFPANRNSSMKRLVFAILASLTILLSAAVSGSTNDTPALKENLVRLEKQSWEAWKNQDDAFFKGFLSDDHVEVGFSGPADKAAVIAGIASHVCHVKSYSVDTFTLTTLYADTALLNYHAAQDTTCGTAAVPSPVWVSSIYQKRGKRWLNIVYQQTQAGK